VKIVIVGAGEVGFHIANRLAHEKKDVVVIDKNPDAVRRISDNIDVQTIIGSGSSPSVLQDAGIKSADILLAVTNIDEVNLVACLVTNLISPSTKKLARLSDSEYDQYHDTFRENAPFIDTVINPEIEVVKTIDELISVPGAVELNEFADGRVKIVGIKVNPDASLTETKLADLPQIIGNQPPLIAAMVRDEKLIIPRGNDHLQAEDLVYFISTEENLTETLKIFGKHVQPVHHVLIIGGGSISLRLAGVLEKRGISTKIIEKDPEKCAFLADKLDKAVVLCGDGSDQNLLKEENIHDMDIVVTLTNDEETNILSSLLARRLGADQMITRISKFSYFPLMSAMGLDRVVSPRLSAINTILQHIRRGKVLSAKTLKDEHAEVIEAVAMETSDIADKPLKKIPFPKGVLVVGIIRQEEVIIPSGESIIVPGDRIIIFALREAVPKLEKILTVKLEYF
jgi:trk system potassium uptake protein TrkA